LVARTLGPQDRATLGYGMAIAAVSTLLGSMGMHWRLSREFRRGDLPEADYRIAAIEVAWLTALFTTLATLLVFGVYQFRGPVLPHIAVVACYAVFTTWFEIGQRFVLFLDHHSLYDRISLLRGLADLGFILTAILLLTDKVNGVLVAHVAAISLGLVAVFVGLRWRPRLTAPWRPRWVSWRNLRESLRFQAMPLVAVLNQYTGVFIVGLIPPTPEAGSYVVAAGIGKLLMMIPESLQTVIIGKAYSIRSRRDIEQYLRQVRAGCLFYLLLSLAVIPLGYFVFPLLFGQAYAGLGIICVAVAVASFFRGVRLLLSGLYAGLDKPERAALIATVGLVCRLAVMPLAVSAYGVPAMAWSSALIAGIEFVLSLRECSRLSKVNVTRHLIPTPADVRHMAALLAEKGRKQWVALTCRKRRD
jgi:O-antigen/teichoic acid export membrane protein